MLAFVMPKNIRGRESLWRFVSTVDQIEERTGLDFFHQLPDPLEASLEAAIDTKSWRLNKIVGFSPS